MASPISRMARALSFRKDNRPNLSPTQNAALRAIKTQKFALSFPYWSMVRFKFTRTGVAPGPYTYTMSNQELHAFAYRIGDAEPNAAGFGGSGLTMALCETNLQKSSETNAGEEFHIQGIAIEPQAGADALLLALIWRNTAAILSLNGGSNRINIGPLALIPGGGGLTGGGRNSYSRQSLDGVRVQEQFMTNGFPNRHNIYPIPEGAVWRRSNERDGQLEVIFQPAPSRNIGFGTGLDEAPAAGVRGYSYPDSDQSYVDVMVWLVGQARGGRSHWQ